MAERAIPLVDLSKYTNGNETEKAEFVQELGKAFTEVGFVGVLNHGISKELIGSFYDKSKSFFAQPEEIKRKYEVAGLAGQRGYTSFGKEHAKHSMHGDLKEFFQIGQEPDGQVDDVYPDNVQVTETADFTKEGMQLYRSFEHTGAFLLEAIAKYLHLDPNYFAGKIKNGNSILRAIHYPPITSEPASAIRSEQHEDINLITLLVGASAGGLQVLDKSNDWVSVKPGHDEIVVNVGDMLQRLTNNKLKSTTHRVVNPPREEWHLPRLSIPFFLHPVSKMELNCLENCITTENPLHYEAITAGAYLDERLREIGLKK